VLARASPPLRDSIELHNPTRAAVDVGGWFLTDDFAVARKYRIPAPTLIPAGGYVSFTEAQFNPVPGVFPSFALRADGEGLWLFSADAASALTGYVDGFHSGATGGGVSAGRHTNSVGEVDVVPQSDLTLGRPNSGPLVGPVVVSEIRFDPADPAALFAVPGYIELANITATPVPLSNPAASGHGWRLRGAVAFEFPPGATLPPGGRLLVAGFDPIGDRRALQTFRAHYAIGPNVPIHGPWRGRLDRHEATLDLERPEASAASSVAYVAVEHVHCLDHAPWPVFAADAEANPDAALVRVALDAYANEPTNWIAATPTPGWPRPDAPQAPGRLTIEPAAAGYRLSYAGQAGRQCDVQRSIDLVRWESRLNVRVPTGGLVFHLEESPPPEGAYYRAVER
jgi:hypothetical protein